MALLASARRLVSRCLQPLARRAARSYVAGETLADADRLAGRLSARGLGVTLGYWDGPDDTPRGLTDEYLMAIEALANREHGYLSIKVPSLGYSHDLMAELVEHATAQRVRLHFDALVPDTADCSRALADEFLDRGANLSYTLPGRWGRSVVDAAWAAERGIVVRVVKGQWADPENPTLDPREGYLQVIDALAGHARHVAVATHDLRLASRAVKRLRDAGTSCQLEFLHGLPMRRSLQLADWLALGVHVYVPYGKAYLPYALSQAQANPRIVWWLARDFVASWQPFKTMERQVATR